MKRRNFLKSIIGAASAVAVPSLVLAKDNIIVRKGLPPEVLRALGMPDYRLTNIHDGSWHYREWKVLPAPEYNKKGLEIYKATRTDQYIHLEIDTALADLFANGNLDKRRGYINSEMDAYIEQANGDNTSIWNVSWDKEGVSKIQPKETRGDEAKQYLKDIEEAMIKVAII